MMRFVAHENVPGPLVRALADAGCDISWARIVARGASDVDILALAARENRILITFDKDFGETARSAGLPATCGVVLLRVPMLG
jgi:predicted nuclease of predicted toxin-antitoxin system